jgi:hypothetical protein
MFPERGCVGDQRQQRSNHDGSLEGGPYHSLIESVSLLRRPHAGRISYAGIMPPAHQCRLDLLASAVYSEVVIF